MAPVAQGISASQGPTQLLLSEADQRQILDLYHQIQCHGAHWVGPDGRSESLAATLPEFLAKLDTSLSAGQWVALEQNAAQLTAAAAARILGVSRQFLIGLLKEGDSISQNLTATTVEE